MRNGEPTGIILVNPGDGAPATLMAATLRSRVVVSNMAFNLRD